MGHERLVAAGGHGQAPGLAGESALRGHLARPGVVHAQDRAQGGPGEPLAEPDDAAPAAAEEEERDGSREGLLPEQRLVGEAEAAGARAAWRALAGLDAPDPTS